MTCRVTPFSPEAYKLALRTAYRERCLREPARCFAEAIERSRNFWPEYEQVNRDYDPDDPTYVITRAGVALSTTADHLHLKAAASGCVRILEIILGGEATVSAVNRIALQRNAATLAGATAQTPEKFNLQSAAAAGTYGFGNTGAILAAATYLKVWVLNAFGGFDDWKAVPGSEPILNNGEVAGLRSLSGTSIFSSDITFEEL